MFVAMDLTISLESELAALLADYDAFVAAEDTLLATDPGLDGSVVADPASVDPVDPLTEEPPAPEVTATVPTATDPVDPAPVEGGSDPAESFSDPGFDPAPFDFVLISDELAFDLNEAALVGRRFGGEFFDFA
ncbi:hypothetical protein [Phenylobacterium sp.]|uniref:hypothetical protein n=1 Tax=Phenylobacterium sp. TaxID=1871053 RepID=UPI003D2695D9